MPHKARQAPTIPMTPANRKPFLRPTRLMMYEAGIVLHMMAKNCRAIGKVARFLLGASSKPIKADTVISNDAHTYMNALHSDNR